MDEVDSELLSLRNFYADLDVSLVDAVWRSSGHDYKAALEQLAEAVKSPSAAARLRQDSLVRGGEDGSLNAGTRGEPSWSDRLLALSASCCAERRRSRGAHASPSAVKLRCVTVCPPVASRLSPPLSPPPPAHSLRIRQR